MEVASFSDIEQEFLARVARIVWCTVATVDRQGRPRTRILHPIWEGSTGWIATGRDSHKAKHVANNPYVSLSYWDQEHQQVYADCKAEWIDDPAEKARLWDLYKATPPPLGYDLGIIWRGGVEDPTYGLLKLKPWRIELFALADMFQAKEPQISGTQHDRGATLPFRATELLVRDIEVSVTFYCELFAFEAVATMGDPPNVALLK